MSTNSEAGPSNTVTTVTRQDKFAEAAKSLEIRLSARQNLDKNETLLLVSTNIYHLVA